MRWLLVLLLLLLAPATALAADYRVTSCDCGKLVLVETDSILRDRLGGVTASFITFDAPGGDGVAPMNQTRARFDCAKGTMRRLSDRTLTRPSPEGFASLARSSPDAGFSSEIVGPGLPPDAAMATVCPGQQVARSVIVRNSSPAEAYDYQAHVFQHANSALPADRLRVWAEAYRQAQVARPVPPPKPAWRQGLDMILRFGLMMGFCFGFAALVRRFGRLPPNEIRYPLAAAAMGPLSGLIALGILILGWLDPEAPQWVVLSFSSGFGALCLAMSPLLLWWRLTMDEKGFTFVDYWRRSRRYDWRDVVHVYEKAENDLVFILRDGRRLTLSMEAHNMERFIDRTVEGGTTALP
ncbi:MAG: hypothetical protein EON95_15620 [Caulobacteraceae bacterium]|nr:MAG: hypothetical protein EON95_15620 [Caulobacteraceae bacterium]